MATDVERLIVRLEVSQNRFERQLRATEQRANRGAKSIEARFAAMNRNISSQLVGVGAAYGAVFGAFAATAGVRRLLDASTQIQNSLKVTGLEGNELARVYDRLFESAQRNFAPLETLATLYSRIGLAQSALGVSTDEMLNFTDKIALALRVQGTTADEARGALIQLSQALGGGIVRAEEFNSIVEGAPSILRAVAAGMVEAGGSVAKLRQLVIDGEVSSQAFFRSFEAGAIILEGMVASAEQTLSQAFVRLQNVLIDTAGKMDDGTGAGQRLADAINDLSDYIAETNFDPLLNGILDFAGAVGQTIARIHELAGALGDLTGASGFGDFVRDRTRNPVRDVFQSTRGSGSGSDAQDAAIQAAFARRRSSFNGTVVDVPVPVRNRVSLVDYPILGNGGGKGKSKGKGRSGGKRTPDEQFARDVEQIRERTAAVQAETAAMGALNPLIDDYGYAIEKTRAEQDLLTAAKRAGVAVTPQLREQIAALSTGYASASVEANKLAETQDEVRRNAEDMQSLGKDVMGGFIGDLKEGISATEALANALDKVGAKLLDIALDGLFNPKAGGSGGIFGALGAIFGSRGFASGTANTGGRRGQARGIVHGQEAVIPLPSGGRVPVDVRLPTATARQAPSSRVFNIDARGAQQGVGEEIRAALAAYDRQLDRTIGTKIAGARGMNRSGF